MLKYYSCSFGKHSKPLYTSAFSEHEAANRIASYKGLDRMQFVSKGVYQIVKANKFLQKFLLVEEITFVE
jgi:hypothetical protein